MKKTSSFVYDFIVGVGAIVFTAIMVLLFVGEQLLPDERTYTDSYFEDYSDGWVRVYNDGTKRTIKAPGQYEVSAGQELVIEKTIDADSRKTRYVTFNSVKQDIYAYVGGEHRYTFSTKDTRIFGSHSPGLYVFIPIYPEDEGKILQIVFWGNNNYTGVLDKISIGSQVGILLSIYNDERYTLILTLFLIVLGLIAFIIGIIVKVAYNRTLSLSFAGWAVVCAGTWFLAESNCKQIFVPNISLMSYMTYISLMMLSYTMALYFDRLQEGRYRMAYMILEVLELFVLLAGIALQLLRKSDLSAMLPYAFLSIILSMLIYLITVIPDFIQGKVKDYILEFIGIMVAFVAGVGQMIAYDDKHPITMDAFILTIGLIFMILMSYIRALRDIRKMERDMFAAVQAQNASSAFLTRMSHEMRTPINAILGMNKLILRESKEENILDYARDVNGAGNYLLSIVNEVLDLAKVNAGKFDINIDDYELMDMIRECYSLIKPRALANRLAFEVDMSDVLPARLRGDKERIIQIITNLLTNAVKYTPEGRIKLSVQGKISGGRLLLMITVSDTGIGIDEESIPYLFDSFTRVGEFQNQRIEGTGLGLTITKQLVEMMGGTITVESEPGKGTAFTVVIPQEIRTVEPCGTFSMGPNGDRRVIDRNEVFDVLGKILVVDDVAINLRVFSMLLNNTDITVDTAISASEALEKIKRNKYDIIFLDHLMPGMDGIQLKEIIMALPDNPNKDTPFIMQTANAVVGAKEQYEAFGFVDYIAKPIKEEELRKLLRRYMI